MKKLASNGALKLGRVTYMVGGQYGFQHVLVITDGNATGDKITVADLQGEILIEHTRPTPEVTYVGNGRPRGPRPTNPETVTKVPDTSTVTDVLMRNCHRCPDTSHRSAISDPPRQSNIRSIH